MAVSLALYRKYRSRKLDEIVGQKHITDVLANAIKQGRISHAYLLTGPRGVGKTSVARILAHEINYLPYSDESTHLDIIEIDAASNNGVDDVRDLREKARLAPISASKKVYIIDEVHMLSKPAFNALLKTLEEPPEHVVFILATTDIDKLPDTIVSRAQRFAFKPIDVKDASRHLKSIAQKENIKISDDAIELIAERGDGSFRDSISLLDQLSSIADDKQGITAELVEASLGLATNQSVLSIINKLTQKDLPGLLKLLEELNSQGVDSIVLSSQIVTEITRQAESRPELLSVIDGLLEVPKSSHPNLKLISVLGQASIKTPIKSVALAVPKKQISASVSNLKKLSETEEAFNENKLLTDVKSANVALYTLLSKCSCELADNKLVIYTKNKFYKKKLDDPKYRTLIHESLLRLNFSDIEIETLATIHPPKDSQAMAAFVIMGGGEEINLEDGKEGSTSWEGSAA